MDVAEAGGYALALMGGAAIAAGFVAIGIGVLVLGFFTLGIAGSFYEECPQCKNKINNGAVVCTHCGAKFN